MASLTDDMIYEKSTDGGESWEEADYQDVEHIIRRCYTDGGLMLANLMDGLVVVTPKGKFRARQDGSPYLRRGHGFDRPYHILSDDGKTSRCGAAHVEHGYELVYRERVLESMTCTNCLIGRKVR